MKSPVVFVDYAPDFFSFEKLTRKLNRLLSNISDFEITALHDKNSLLEKYCREIDVNFHISKSLQETRDKATHAVFFIDSKQASELPDYFSGGVPVKLVKLELAKVVNKDRGENFDVYIGRGTAWGNPYAIGQDGDREEVVRKFEYDFDRKLHGFFENNGKDLHALKGKILGCHCKPAACHGDILVRYLNSLDDGK